MEIPLITLRNEAKDEVYKLIDQKFRKLPKKSDGSIDTGIDVFHDNDLDALRHAYVSGVFTQNYGSALADVLGRLNELFPLNGASDANRVQSRNTDLWNNSIGRKYGQQFKTREELFDALLKALKNGELIQDLSDKRKYTGLNSLTPRQNAVVVVKEIKGGKNEVFYDTKKSILMSRDEFIRCITQGQYPNYSLRKMANGVVPVSRRDKSRVNNLG